MDGQDNCSRYPRGPVGPLASGPPDPSASCSARLRRAPPSRRAPRRPEPPVVCSGFDSTIGLDMISRIIVRKCASNGWWSMGVWVDEAWSFWPMQRHPYGLPIECHRIGRSGPTDGSIYPVRPDAIRSSVRAPLGLRSGSASVSESRSGFAGRGIASLLATPPFWGDCACRGRVPSENPLWVELGFVLGRRGSSEGKGISIATWCLMLRSFFLSPVRCSRISENLFGFVRASPSLGCYAANQEVLRDGDMHRTMHDRSMLEDVLRNCLCVALSWLLRSSKMFFG